MGSGASKRKDITYANAEIKTKPVDSFNNNVQSQEPLGETERQKSAPSKTSFVGDNRARELIDIEPLSLIESTKADSEGVGHILRGNPKYGYESKPRIVRIFTSSTFTDTYYERNKLMEEVYPNLKDFCQRFGYEFQVVDMRWGVREDAENDHMATELCLRELKACQKLSTGPYFVSFLSHKYGYRPFPRIINADEFDVLTDEVTEEEEKLIDKWFLLDENIVPAVYVLQPIKKHFSDFLSDDPEGHKRAKDDWWSVFLQLQKILVRGAKENLMNPAKCHNYLMSVTEREITAGILDADDVNKHCLWFRRIFDDIEKVPRNRELSRYYEIASSDAVSIEEVKSQIHDLRDLRTPKKLSSSNIFPYHINWKSPGVNPKDPQHAAYLDQLCNDFMESMKAMIQRGIQEQQQDDAVDPVVVEVLEHSAFRHNTCNLFSGRENILEDLKNYVTGSSTQPLILIGGSGSGKTSVLAKAAELAWDWLQGSGSIICRFLGMTKQSSSIKPLLKTLNKQIQLLYGSSSGSDKLTKSEDMKTLMQGFAKLLKKVPTDSQLLLVLDSLDNIDTADGGRQLEWLPRQLPTNVKVILSMRPDEQYGVFPRCKTIFVRDSCYRIITQMELSEVEEVINRFLKKNSRSLTALQRRVLLEGYKVSPSPLYLKLALDESLRWHSYDPAEVTRLYGSVPSMIAAFFKRIEQQHGQTLVSFALAYFTAAQNGLSETEMEDLLSLNDTVLTDVYQFWVPPVRRLPPMLWVRIKTDLEPYLGKRSMGGCQLYTWNYGLFYHTCSERYLANDSSRQLCHSIMSDYFQGLWADKPKPYKDPKTAELKSALRYVAKQPLRFDNGQYNLRKLHQLPFHLTQSHNLTVLKKEVLCNYEFLLAKISAVGISAVLRDFKLAQLTFPKDEDITIILEVLQLSQHAIEYSAHELAGQLIGRLYMNLSANDTILHKAQSMLSANQLDPESVAMVTTLTQMLETLVEYQNTKYANLTGLVSQARSSSQPVLVPHSACLVKPGGQLLHKLSGHHETINAMDITSTGAILVTGSDDNTIKLWDIASGEILVSCEVNSDVLYLALFPDNTTLVASTVLGTVYIIDVAMGTIVMEKDNIGGTHSNLPLAVCDLSKVNKKNRTVMVAVLTERDVMILAGRTLKQQSSCPHCLELEDQSAGRSLLIHGHKNQVVYASHLGNELFIMTLRDPTHPAVTKYTVFEMPEKISKRKQLISCMTIIPDRDQAVVCSGYTHGLYFITLATGEITLHVQSHKRDTIEDLFFSEPESLLYFTSKHDVGTLDLSSGDRKYQFPHPSQVRKIISCDKQFVVSLGADNILRIWDKTMGAFTPDVSLFTGKVTVHSRESMDTFKSILGTFSEEFALDPDESQSIITTEDVSNYWTPDRDQVFLQEDVTTRFSLMPNKRYLVGTQNGAVSESANKRFTQCITIWDLVGLHCVRRFFPVWHSMYVHGAMSSKALLFTDLGDEGSPLYLLDVSGTAFKPVMVYEGPAKLKLGCDLVIVQGTNLALGESCTGELTLYDISIGEVKCVLRPKTQPSGDGTHFHNIVVAPGSQNVLAMHGTRYLCVWLVQSGALTWELDLFKHVENLSLSPVPIVTVQCTLDNKFIIVQTDLPKSREQTKASASLAVLELKSGNFVSDLKREPSTPCVHRISLLRLGQDKLLQLVGITEKGTAHLLDEQRLGKYANRMLVSDCGTRCVTWCVEDKEQRLCYWALCAQTSQRLGSFTVDEQLHAVHVDAGGQSVVVSTATGLVRLDITGTNKAATPHINKLSTLFEDTELDVQMEV